ncbi:MAG: c-type cytochrome [Burkholderiales bacterium]
MKTFITALVLFGIAGTAVAAPFDKGDPKVGKSLLDKSCINCHAAKFGGDGSSIYTRPNRIVHNPAQLAARITACNVNTGTGWFPEEETDVAAYLNQKYYKFK